MIYNSGFTLKDLSGKELVVNIQTDYTLAFQPLSQSWVEGTGKFGDIPKNTNGCSWNNRFNPTGGSETAWISHSLGGYDGDRSFSDCLTILIQKCIDNNQSVKKYSKEWRKLTN